MSRGWLVGMAVLFSGCFYYDSQWGQTKKAQQRAAERYRPKLPARSASVGGADLAQPARLRSVRVRVHAGSGYVVETANWDKRLKEVVEAANSTLAAELGMQLEIVDSRPWSAREGSGGLYTLLEELRRTDPGDDVDLVVGLTGSLSRLVFSFHELGMADVFGKHIVLRATNDALEYEALQKALNELDENERSAVYRARILHKATSVLLHEVGHAIGAPHCRDPQDVMTAGYHTRVGGFSAGTLRVLSASLTEPGERLSITPARARALADALRASEPEHWVAEEKEQTLARLDGMSVTRAPTPQVDAPGAVRDEHRTLYRQVVAERDAGHFLRALELGQLLFTSYPLDFEIQDLRCSIAMRAGVAFAAAQRECEPLMLIMRSTRGTAKPASSR